VISSYSFHTVIITINIITITVIANTSSTVVSTNTSKNHSDLRLQDHHHCRRISCITSKSTDIITIITIMLPSPATSTITISVTTTIYCLLKHVAGGKIVGRIEVT
jgi:hypothetical protein